MKSKRKHDFFSVQTLNRYDRTEIFQNNFFFLHR